MTIETIIKLVLVLVVAFTLIFIFSDKTSLFQKSNTCEQRGGICTTACDGETILLAGCEEGQVCCVDIG